MPITQHRIMLKPEYQQIYPDFPAGRWLIAIEDPSDRAALRPGDPRGHAAQSGPAERGSAAEKHFLTLTLSVRP